MSDNKNSSYHIKLPILLTIAVIVGILIGSEFAEPKTDKKYLSSILKFRELLEYIENDYVDSVDTETLIEESIENMLDKLDPHTIYIPPKDRERTAS
ncbi:MAG: carboxyl-terminal processing protease, partial [Roseivirga sp.]